MKQGAPVASLKESGPCKWQGGNVAQAAARLTGSESQLYSY